MARLVRVGVGDKTEGLLGDLLVFQAEVAGLLRQATTKKKWKVPVESGVLLVSVLLVPFKVQ